MDIDQGASASGLALGFGADIYQPNGYIEITGQLQTTEDFAESGTHALTNGEMIDVLTDLVTALRAKYGATGMIQLWFGEQLPASANKTVPAVEG